MVKTVSVIDVNAITFIKILTPAFSPSPPDASMKVIKESIPLENLKEEYDAYYLPGGHGTVVDFPDNQKLQSLIGAAWDNSTLRSPQIVPLCHRHVALSCSALP